MNMVFRQIGGAIQKTGINIEETARALKIKHLGQKNGDSVETITENLSKAGQEAKERLAAVDQKIAEKNNASKAYKEAYHNSKNGDADDSVVRDAINRDREAKQKTPLRTAGDERANVNLGGENPGVMYTEPAAPVNEVAVYHENPYADRDLKTAEEVLDSGDRSGILDMVKAHPFISAGIAGGVGVLGANIFDDDDDE